MTMADEGVRDSSSRKLHPLFVKAPAVANLEQMTVPTTQADNEHDSKRIKTNEHTAPQQQFMRNYVNVSQHSGASAPYCAGSQPPVSTIDGESPLTSSPATPNSTFHSGLNLPVSSANDPKFQAPLPLAPAYPKSATESPLPGGLATDEMPSLVATPQQSAPPKKVLRFNMRTGTLGSPPKPKATKVNSKIVSIKYGQNGEDRKRIGDQIVQILSGQLRIEPATKALKSKANNKPKEKAAQAASKTPHPFFAKGKPPDAQPKSEKKRDTVFMSTPVSPRKPQNVFLSAKVPSYGLKPTGMRISGAKHPLWPPNGFSHTRGAEQLVSPCIAAPINRPRKKFKGQTVSVNSQESVLGLLSGQLDIPNVKRSLPKNDNLFTPPPVELRLPTRHFESGYKLARRIRSEVQSEVVSLTASQNDMDEDDLAREPSNPVHPIVGRHWQSLARQLSAFDRSTCESMSWASKYAPVGAAEVLQPGREVPLMKQWLEMLRVQGVESAKDGSAKQKGETKQKKRKSKLDGFVVDSEDESGEMNELSDLEDQPPNAKRRLRPSVARSLNLAGKDPSKLANALLISGPHGSGKSAAVYAVAKELGFEVFEINSSTRRSGKDILERVGDMTRNHLVQHRSEGTGSTAPAEEQISSNKQNTMTSFFKPNAEKKKKKHLDKTRARADVGSRSPSSKSQKQSLILVEEVDILFDEDKQFWASLQSLMAQSKRPFIFTCNDESAVPIHTLDLHGIFRFSPPPEHLAVDTCLLIAANEGHALKRHAVQALYRCRNFDLRGTITDLQFWCQIGVGDRRGGHDWFYLRWPKGIDLDKQGQVVRVISGDTYQTGMGWLSRDRIVAAPDTQAMEQEAAEQAWQFWRQDLSDWHSTKDLAPLSAATLQDPMSRQQRAKNLEAYTEYYDALSCADVCAAGALGLELDEMLDPTLPEMPIASRDDFTVAHALLQADSLQPHFCSRVAVSSALSALALSKLKTSATSLASSAPHSTSQAYGEQKTTAILEAQHEKDNHQLTRYDVAVAFDPIAVSPKAVGSMSLDPSVFDRTMTMIVVEVAPWVRSIVHYDDQLMQDRQRLNDLLGDGGRRKRMRTTRSAYSALEGGERRTTRKERYFGDCLSTEAVMATGQGWQQALPRERFIDTEEDPTSSPVSDSADCAMTSPQD
ncbi:AAA-core [Cordyceps militaris]|uniref:AAA-core n=1 Tax=Cordyceps militaris TaxID=73501 RepID=A0A2H4S905_CORMI|nr:AAA-core [Cordyceps militaris]